MGRSAQNEIEAYRKAERSLRLLLLGDGMDSPGLVKGDELRRQVTTQLRHMRDALDSVLESERAGAGEASLADALRRRILSADASAQRDEHAIPSLLTPAEAAQALGVSVTSVYRSIREGQIRAVRLADKGGGLRVPSSELEK